MNKGHSNLFCAMFRHYHYVFLTLFMCFVIISSRIYFEGSIEVKPFKANIKHNVATLKIPVVEGDSIGFYCPISSLDNEALDSVQIDVESDEVQFYFANARRGDCEFRHFRNKETVLGFYGFSASKSLKVKIGKSNVVKLKSNVAMNAHIALTENKGEMRVMWVSNTPMDIDTPIVLYGETKDNLNKKIKGISKTYPASDMCGFPADTPLNKGGGFIDPGYLHEAVLTGLEPGKRYFYAFGQPKTGNLTETRSFAAAPKVDPEYSFSFILYADMGHWGGEAAASTAKAASKMIKKEDGTGDCELVVHAGDISYARGFAYHWDKWSQLVESYSTQVPYMLGVGNHEYDHSGSGGKDPSGAKGSGFHPSWGNYGDDSGGECGVPLAHRFTMPSNGNGLFWYSFDYGSVHFIMVSTEHDSAVGSPQYMWLERDLASVDRSKTPWIIVQGHRPMYNSEDYYGDYQVSLGQRKMYEDLMLRYEVDFAWYGHYHSYERTCVVAKGECVKFGEGITHFTIGCAGYYVEDAANLLNKKWSMYQDNNWGLVKVSVANSTALLIEYIRNKDSIVADKVWIYKKNKTTSVNTINSCICKEVWQGKNEVDHFYKCQNPDGDPKGTWCKVKESNCGEQKADVINKGKGVVDYCQSKEEVSNDKTEKGCTCLSPYRYKQRKYYGCAYASNDSFAWCKVNKGCGNFHIIGEYHWDVCNLTHQNTKYSYQNTN